MSPIPLVPSKNPDDVAQDAKNANNDPNHPDASCFGKNLVPAYYYEIQLVVDGDYEAEIETSATPPFAHEEIVGGTLQYEWNERCQRMDTTGVGGNPTGDWIGFRGFHVGTVEFYGCSVPTAERKSASDTHADGRVGFMQHNGARDSMLGFTSEAAAMAWASNSDSSKAKAEFTLILTETCDEDDPDCGIDPGGKSETGRCLDCAQTSAGAPVSAPTGQLASLIEEGIRVAYGAGRTTTGNPTGRLHFSDTFSSTNFLSRDNLEFRNMFDQTSAPIEDSNGEFRQIKSNTTLLDAEGGGSSAIEIKAYEVDVNLAADGSGFYDTTQGTLLRSQKIVSTSHNGIDGVRLLSYDAAGNEIGNEAIFGAGTGSSSFRRHEENGIYTETENFLSNTTVNGANHSWDRQEIVTILEDDGQGGETEVSKTTYNYKKILDYGEELLVSIVEDPDGDAETTTYAYHEDPNSPQLLGKQDWVLYSSGDWSRTVYDANGVYDGTLSPWLDAPADPSQATTANCRYQSDGVEKILGQAVGGGTGGREVFVVEDPYDENVEKEEILWELTWGDDLNAKTESYYSINAETGRRDRLKRRIYPDGRMVIYQLNNPNDLDEQTVITTHVDSPDGIPGYTTKVITYSNGNRETYILGVGGYDPNPAISAVYTKDAEDRIIKVEENGVTISETDYDYDDDGTEDDTLRTDRYGGETLTTNDGNTTVQIGAAAGAEWLAQPDITTTQTELANGDTQTTISAGNLTMTSTYSEDSYTDETGATTTTTTANGGKTVTETGPGGVTVTTQYYLDGQLKQIEGAGVVNRYHTYSVANGAITETVHFGTSTSQRWRKTKRLNGSVVETREPGPNGNDVVSSYSYDEAAGRTVVTRTGMASQITERGPFITRTGLDMDGDGQLNRASTDRISETETFYKNDNGWRQVT
ncbi:MAG: hypothetical protein AAF497_11230, partial [Planctomycetota bacterium]